MAFAVALTTYTSVDAAGSNKNVKTDLNTAKLDRDTEELTHQHVNLSVAKAIQQARLEKGLSQKDLAVKINEKASVINEYESQKAIPNQQILGKMERILGVKLRGNNIGAKLGGPKK